jgi:uncharacterized protein YciI
MPRFSFGMVRLTGKLRVIDAARRSPGAVPGGCRYIASPGGGVHFLLFYQFVPDYLQRRPPHRSEHLRLAWEAHGRGELILAGALAEPADAAVLLFEGDNDAAARAFVAADPYVKAGLVRQWSLRPWTTVVGDAAATPVRS